MGIPQPARRYGQAPEVSPEIQRIADFLEARRHEGKAAGEALPVPLLHQLDRRLNIRRRFGSVFVHLMLAWASTEPDAVSGVKRLSQDVFAGLDDIRDTTDPDGRIPQALRDTTRANAQGIHTPTLEVGRHVLRVLSGHPAHGAADDALLSLELAAARATATVAEPA